MSAIASKTEQGKSAWSANASLFSPEQRAVGDELIALDQGHLFAHWPAPGTHDDDKKRFINQVSQVESAYIGGVSAYVSRAKQLLKLAVLGANPYEGFKVEEPKDAVRLETQADFDKYEALGMERISKTAFVIVAGGLGERLGYKGIKLALPSEVSTEACYLELYVRWILALQDRARAATGNQTLELQFAIMTSDDTDHLTRELLTTHNRFGMSESQLTVFKQGKVPSLLDNDAHFTLEENDQYALDTKPHGHGDVHSLLFKEGIVERWVKGQAGNAAASSSSSASVLPVDYIVFFQDTNGLVFHSIVASVGVSIEKNLHMNSITVPRAQGDAVGAICTLLREQPKQANELGPEDLPNQLTINVEYNQLESLLGKGVKEPLTAGTNYSVYPGNINVLILNAPEYLKLLREKKGVIPEFVNPKYNPDKQSFKKPTRLETMMQEWPKLIPAGAGNVGFTQFQRIHAFSAVKNAVEDGVAKQKTGNAAEVAATGERDMYEWFSLIFQESGALIPAAPVKTYKGIQVAFTPRIVLSPSFGTTQAEIRSKLTGRNHIKLSADSTLIVEGKNVTIQSLDLEGSLIVEVHPQATVRIEGLTVKNHGWEFDELTPDREKAGIDQKYSIRGYTLGRKQQDYYVFDKPGNFVLSDATKQQYSKEFTFPPKRV